MVIDVPAMSRDVRAVLAVKSSIWITMLSPGDPLSGTAVTLPSTSNLELLMSAAAPTVLVFWRPSIAFTKLQSDTEP